VTIPGQLHSIGLLVEHIAVEPIHPDSQVVDSPNSFISMHTSVRGLACYIDEHDIGEVSKLVRAATPSPTSNSAAASVTTAKSSAWIFDLSDHYNISRLMNPLSRALHSYVLPATEVHVAMHVCCDSEYRSLRQANRSLHLFVPTLSFSLTHRQLVFLNAVVHQYALFQASIRSNYDFDSNPWRRAIAGVLKRVRESRWSSIKEFRRDLHQYVLCYSAKLLCSAATGSGLSFASVTFTPVRSALPAVQGTPNPRLVQSTVKGSSQMPFWMSEQIDVIERRWSASQIMMMREFAEYELHIKSLVAETFPESVSAVAIGPPKPTPSRFKAIMSSVSNYVGLTPKQDTMAAAAAMTTPLTTRVAESGADPLVTDSALYFVLQPKYWGRFVIARNAHWAIKAHRTPVDPVLMWDDWQHQSFAFVFKATVGGNAQTQAVLSAISLDIQYLSCELCMFLGPDGGPDHLGTSLQPLCLLQADRIHLEGQQSNEYLRVVTAIKSISCFDQRKSLIGIDYDGPDFGMHLHSPFKLLFGPRGTASAEIFPSRNSFDDTWSDQSKASVPALASTLVSAWLLRHQVPPEQQHLDAEYQNPRDLFSLHAVIPTHHYGGGSVRPLETVARCRVTINPIECAVNMSLLHMLVRMIPASTPSSASSAFVPHGSTSTFSPWRHRSAKRIGTPVAVQPASVAQLELANAIHAKTPAFHFEIAIGSLLVLLPYHRGTKHQPLLFGSSVALEIGQSHVVAANCTLSNATQADAHDPISGPVSRFDDSFFSTIAPSHSLIDFKGTGAPLVASQVHVDVLSPLQDGVAWTNFYQRCTLTVSDVHLFLLPTWTSTVLIQKEKPAWRYVLSSDMRFHEFKKQFIFASLDSINCGLDSSMLNDHDVLPPYLGTVDISPISVNCSQAALNLFQLIIQSISVYDIQPLAINTSQATPVEATSSNVQLEKTLTTPHPRQSELVDYDISPGGISLSVSLLPTLAAAASPVNERFKNTLSPMGEMRLDRDESFTSDTDTRSLYSARSVLDLELRRVKSAGVDTGVESYMGAAARSDSFHRQSISRASMSASSDQESFHSARSEISYADEQRADEEYHDPQIVHSSMRTLDTRTARSFQKFRCQIQARALSIRLLGDDGLNRVLQSPWPIGSVPSLLDLESVIWPEDNLFCSNVHPIMSLSVSNASFRMYESWNLQPGCLCRGNNCD
jgi:hypothetical protein